MKTKFNKMISLLLCVVVFCSMGLVSIVYAVDGQAMYSSGEVPSDFCEIKRTTATVTINPLEKVELYAKYEVNTDESYELVWSIDGKSYFLNGGIDKATTGSEIELLFLDDTTVKLQIVASNGDVLCEDEVFLKSYYDKDRPFWLNLQSYILLPIIVFVGVVGGTVGPWIGELINLFK